MEKADAPEGAPSAWMAAMRCGDFEAAWRETDRVEAERRRTRPVLQPHHLLWDGTDFAGREVLVRCRHGLGDTLQFVRFGARLRETARSVTFLVPPPLVDFLREQPHLGKVRNGWTDFDGRAGAVEIEVMELAYALRATAESVGVGVPYLFAAPVPPLDSSNGLNVGLLWAASDWDTRRSIPLECFDVLGRLPGVQFHSLQQGASAAEWRASQLALRPLFEHTGEIAQAASAMTRLDLIITVDGMAAHLAGALGRPVWVLLRHDADWRWMERRTDCPWYPTMRLFRQPAPGDWRAVIEEVAAELSQRVNSPVSLTRVTFDQPSPMSSTLTEAGEISKRSSSSSEIAK